MDGKKCSAEKQNKRKAVRATIALKKDIIAKYTKGVRICHLTRMFNMPKSTVYTIIKNMAAIKAADVAHGVTTLTTRRSQNIETMEKLLAVWINEKQLEGNVISDAILCEKARSLHDDLTKDMVEKEEFKASRGWCQNFKKRSAIQDFCVREQEDVTGSNSEPADKFIEEFKEFVETEDYVPNQVFSCDEMGLFWKKMPRRTYIAKEEKSIPGHKPSKDRLTLLLCGNASGACKIKPLLVYHTENPRVFKQNNIMKSRLNVMWRSNVKVQLTRQFFTEWIHEEFGPSVKTFLLEKNLPLKALLLLNNTIAYSSGLEDDLVSEFGFITIKYLPPDITPLFQPVISNFKRLYTKGMLQRCLEVTNDTELTLREFWNNHYSILHCLRVIEKAWREVSARTMNLAWVHLWPECVNETPFDGLEESASLIQEIISLCTSMFLEVNEKDINELLDDHRNELTTHDLLLLHQQQKQEITDEISSEMEERETDRISTSEIKELLSMWSKIQHVAEKWHPDGALVNKCVNLFNENIIEHFRKIKHNRRYQNSFERWLSTNSDPLHVTVECDIPYKQELA